MIVVNTASLYSKVNNESSPAGTEYVGWNVINVVINKMNGTAFIEFLQRLL